ncbi:uncharacterized protein LOC129928096 [Biomphalaria glabrata]|uniref:Uncharacterized protein LOC129928096 n=1 Tax=Biomphalaria glabrata TaxID=6526 RepID=A0A9W3BAS9_BIOGL|nr:uncharacterized protein LOC129928096 [Biomphalaria glabrata]
MFYSRLATLEEQTFPDQHLENKFRQFKNTIQSLIDVFRINEEPTPQATLTQADILKIPVFKGKGKKTNSTRNTPTLPSLLSGKEFQQALKKKIDRIEETDRKKIVTKLQKDELKRKKEEEKATNKVVKDKEKVEKQMHKQVIERKKLEAKKMNKPSTSKDIDEDSEDNPSLRREMDKELAAGVDGADQVRNQTTKDTCSGCGKKGGNNGNI